MTSSIGGDGGHENLIRNLPAVGTHPYNPRYNIANHSGVTDNSGASSSWNCFDNSNSPFQARSSGQTVTGVESGVGEKGGEGWGGGNGKLYSGSSTYVRSIDKRSNLESDQTQLSQESSKLFEVNAYNQMRPTIPVKSTRVYSFSLSSRPPPQSTVHQLLLPANSQGASDAHQFTVDSQSNLISHQLPVSTQSGLVNYKLPVNPRTTTSGPTVTPSQFYSSVPKSFSDQDSNAQNEQRLFGSARPTFNRGRPWTSGCGSRPRGDRPPLLGDAPSSAAGERTEIPVQENCRTIPTDDNCILQVRQHRKNAETQAFQQLETNKDNGINCNETNNNSYNYFNNNGVINGTNNYDNRSNISNLNNSGNRTKIGYNGSDNDICTSNNNYTHQYAQCAKLPPFLLPETSCFVPYSDDPRFKTSSNVTVTSGHVTNESGAQVGHEKNTGILRFTSPSNNFGGVRLSLSHNQNASFTPNVCNSQNFETRFGTDTRCTAGGYEQNFAPPVQQALGQSGMEITADHQDTLPLDSSLLDRDSLDTFSFCSERERSVPSWLHCTDGGLQIGSGFQLSHPDTATAPHPRSNASSQDTCTGIENSVSKMFNSFGSHQHLNHKITTSSSGVGSGNRIHLITPSQPSKYTGNNTDVMSVAANKAVGLPENDQGPRLRSGTRKGTRWEPNKQHMADSGKPVQCSLLGTISNANFYNGSISNGNIPNDTQEMEKNISHVSTHNQSSEKFKVCQNIVEREAAVNSRQSLEDYCCRICTGNVSVDDHHELFNQKRNEGNKCDITSSKCNSSLLENAVVNHRCGKFCGLDQKKQDSSPCENCSYSTVLHKKGCQNDGMANTTNHCCKKIVVLENRCTNGDRNNLLRLSPSATGSERSCRVGLEEKRHGRVERYKCPLLSNNEDDERYPDRRQRRLLLDRPDSEVPEHRQTLRRLPLLSGPRFPREQITKVIDCSEKEDDDWSRRKRRLSESERDGGTSSNHRSNEERRSWDVERERSGERQGTARGERRGTSAARHWSVENEDGANRDRRRDSYDFMNEKVKVLSQKTRTLQKCIQLGMLNPSEQLHHAQLHISPRFRHSPSRGSPSRASKIRASTRDGVRRSSGSSDAESKTSSGGCSERPVLDATAPTKRTCVYLNLKNKNGLVNRKALVVPPTLTLKRGRNVFPISPPASEILDDDNEPVRKKNNSSSPSSSSQAVTSTTFNDHFNFIDEDRGKVLTVSRRNIEKIRFRNSHTPDRGICAPDTTSKQIDKKTAITTTESRLRYRAASTRHDPLPSGSFLFRRNRMTDVCVTDGAATYRARASTVALRHCRERRNAVQYNRRHHDDVGTVTTKTRVATTVSYDVTTSNVFRSESQVRERGRTNKSMTSERYGGEMVSRRLGDRRRSSREKEMLTSDDVRNQQTSDLWSTHQLSPAARKSPDSSRFRRESPDDSDFRRESPQFCNFRQKSPDMYNCLERPPEAMDFPASSPVGDDRFNASPQRCLTSEDNKEDIINSYQKARKLKRKPAGKEHSLHPYVPPRPKSNREKKRAFFYAKILPVDPRYKKVRIKVAALEAKAVDAARDKCGVESPLPASEAARMSASLCDSLRKVREAGESSVSLTRPGRPIRRPPLLATPPVPWGVGVREQRSSGRWSGPSADSHDSNVLTVGNGRQKTALEILFPISTGVGKPPKLL